MNEEGNCISNDTTGGLAFWNILVGTATVDDSGFLHSGLFLRVFYMVSWMTAAEEEGGHRRMSPGRRRERFQMIGGSVP